MTNTPWRTARAIDALRGQINALAPRRNKISDGTIGDAAHAKTKSDHNPNAAGVVLAVDITHDPAGGCDCNVIAESLVASRDERIQYIIWNRRICNREVSPWTWRPYNGSNPHTRHIHISMDEKPALYDSAAPWNVRVKADGPVAPAPVPSAPLEPPPVKPDPPSPHPTRPPDDPEDATRGDGPARPSPYASVPVWIWYAIALGVAFLAGKFWGATKWLLGKAWSGVKAVGRGIVKIVDTIDDNLFGNR
jgi:hypothetical protein